MLVIDKTLNIKRNERENYQCIFDERKAPEYPVTAHAYRASWGVHHTGTVYVKDNSELYSDVFIDFW